MNWSSAIFILSSSFFSYQSLSDCFARACKIYNFSAKYSISLPLKLFLFMTFYLFAPFVYLCIYIPLFPFAGLINFFIFNYPYIFTGIILVLISTFCIIAQKSYTNINRDLKQHVSKIMKQKVFLHFTDQLEQYLEVAKFVTNFAKYFSPFFLIIFLSVLFRLIAYTLMVVELRRVGHFHDFLACAVHTFYFIIWLLFLCYRCHRVQQEVRIS